MVIDLVLRIGIMLQVPLCSARLHISMLTVNMYVDERMKGCVKLHTSVS